MASPFAVSREEGTRNSYQQVSRKAIDNSYCWDEPSWTKGSLRKARGWWKWHISYANGNHQRSSLALTPVSSREEPPCLCTSRFPILPANKANGTEGSNLLPFLVAWDITVQAQNKSCRSVQVLLYTFAGSAHTEQWTFVPGRVVRHFLCPLFLGDHLPQIVQRALLGQKRMLIGLRLVSSSQLPPACLSWGASAAKTVHNLCTEGVSGQQICWRWQAAHENVLQFRKSENKTR